jgi:flagellar biogenesis protein FliO
MEESPLFRRCGMISAISIFFVIAIVLTLILILRLILSFHQDDGIIELDIREKRKRGPL